MLKINMEPRIYHCEQDWSWSPGPMRDFDLWIVLRGEGQLILDGRHFPLSAGMAFLFVPRDSPRATQNPKAPLEVFACHFTVSRKSTMPSWLKYCPKTIHVHLPDIEFIEKIAVRCDQAWHSNGHVDKELSLRLLEAAILHLVSMRNAPKQSTADHKIMQLADAIRRDPGKHRPPSALARQVGLSIPQLNRRFRECLGDSPVQYIIRKRIARAVQLLQETDLTIAQIADALGYTDIYFFHRQFKKTVGATPSFFKKRAPRGRNT